MKKQKIFMMTLLALLLCFSMPKCVKAITVEYIDSSKLLSSDYGFSVDPDGVSTGNVVASSQFTFASSKTYTANATYENIYYYTNPTTGAYIRYKNIGYINGQAIDLKVTITEIGSQESIRGLSPEILFFTNSFNFVTIGLEYVTFKYEFCISGTDTLVDNKFWFSLIDIDWGQQVTMISGVEKVYLSTDTVLHVSGDMVYADTSYQYDEQGEDGEELLNSECIIQLFMSNGAQVRCQSPRWKPGSGGAISGDLVQFGLAIVSFAPFDQPDPTKTTSTTSATIGSNITYKISQFVPMEDLDYAYTTFVMSDTLPSCLSIDTSSIKVYDASNSDVTYMFNISTSGQYVQASAKSQYLSTQGFYCNTYTLQISCTVTGSNLSSYTTSSGTIISNTGTVQTSRGTKTTNTVTTEVTYSIDTYIDHGTITSSMTGVKGGSSKTITFTPQKGYYITKIIVDGVEQNVSNYTITGDTYTFSNISANHDIKVYTEPMTIKITIDKRDSETGKTTQGDAVFTGAQYTIYTDASCTNAVETLTVDSTGYATSSALPLVKYVNGSYVYYEYYYVKETKAPTGYNIDETVYTVHQSASSQTTAQTAHTVTSKEDVIKNNIIIYKNIDKTDSTLKKNLSGAVFSATLNSDTSKVYYSTTTDANGYCIITDLPYGTYTITEYTIPSTAYAGWFYVGASSVRVQTVSQFIKLDSNTGTTYTFSDITDVPKKMNITIYKEDAETGTTTQGDAHLEGAKYTIYRDKDCTDAVETLTIAKNNDGTYSATSGWYLVGTYYVKEDVKEEVNGTKYSYAEGYLVDETVYTVSQDPASQTTEYKSFSITSKEYVIRNDIEIIKNIEETSNTEQSILDKCEFTATLVSSMGTSSEFSVKCTAPTDENGYCIIEDLPYGKYVIEETTVSPISLKCANFYIYIELDKSDKTDPYVPKDAYKWDDITLGEEENTTKTYYGTESTDTYNWLDEDGNIVDVAKVMQIKIRKVDEYVSQYETATDHTYSQGDAVLEGAVYEIYRYDPDTDAYTEYVYDITVDHIDDEGYWCAESDDLLVGKYMVIEKIKSTEVGADGKTYKYSYGEGYLVDETEYYFEVQPDTQDYRVSYHSAISTEQVIRGRIDAIKYNDNSTSSDKSPATGAVLRLTLVSDPTVYYDATVDEYGYIEWVEEKSREKYYPYTIPYGTYVISEIQASNSGENIFIDKQITTISYSTQYNQYILEDEYVTLKLTIEKRDIETGVLIPNEARYKIWDVNNECWYSEISYPSGEYISEFKTDDQGQLTINGNIEAGSYVIYEIQAPYGYYLDDELRVTSTGYEFTVGVEQDGVVVVYHDDERTVLDHEEVVYQNIPVTMYYYTAKIYNTPQKVIIKITDLADQFTKTDEEESEYGDVQTPVFEKEGLENAEFDIIAAEDIYTEDGTLRYEEGQIVAHVTTDEDGKCETDELYLGKYYIVQTDVPDGYILEDTVTIEVEYTNQYEKVQVVEVEFDNEKQEINLEFEKLFEELEVSNFKFDEKKAIFGIYTATTIKNYRGQNTIGQDELVDIIETDENNMVVNNVELPEGSYYVKELYVSNPYKLATDVYYFTVEYDNTQEAISLTINDGQVTNEASIGELEVLVYPEDIYDGYDIEDYPDVYDPEEEAKLIVKYVDEETLEEIAPQENIYGDPGQAYETQEKTIDGYTYSKVEGNTTGTLTDEVVEVIYYYTKNTDTKLIVKYLELDQTEDDNTDNKVLAPTVGIEGEVGQSYLTEQKEIEGYTFVKVVGKTEGTLTDDVLEVIYYYVKTTLDKEGLESIARAYGIANKVYGIYNDEACQDPLITNDGEYATFTTDEMGRIYIPDMPTGIYYLKETVAAWGYELSDEVIKVEITESKVTVATISEPYKKAKLLQKTDDFTGDVIAEVTFQITDENEDVIYTGQTDENGIVWVPIIFFENGATYHYQEIDAPDYYEIDDEKYEFVASYNEDTCEWTLDLIDVVNDRKTIDYVKVIKTDSDTGERLEGCVFTIVLLDDNGNEYVNQYGETIYLVENATTDENGEYIIENVPYGTYKFVEMVAPEGYELDADMTGLTFTANDDTKGGIIFEVTNTGDIAIIAISVILVLSIAGIVTVLLKMKKRQVD